MSGSSRNGCHWCGQKFGLIRHYLYAWWFQTAFCSKRCKERYISYHRKKGSFFRWLFADS